MPRGVSKKGATTPKVSKSAVEAPAEEAPAKKVSKTATPKVSRTATTPKVSRTATTPKVSKAAAEPPAPESPAEIITVYEMAFTEGDAVMAKWPGTNLFFKAKVTFVRDEDNEYDVQVRTIG